MISVADLKTALRIDTLEDAYEEEAQAVDVRARAVGRVLDLDRRHLGLVAAAPRRAPLGSVARDHEPGDRGHDDDGRHCDVSPRASHGVTFCAGERW